MTGLFVKDCDVTVGIGTVRMCRNIYRIEKTECATAWS